MVSLLNDMTADHPAKPVLVLSNNPDAGGLAKASALGIPTAVVDHRDFAGDRIAFQNKIQSELTSAGADIVCLAGFMRILTAEFTDQWDGAMLNIHPSLLPKYKGLNTHARALEAGDTVHGCTVHQVTSALDDGPILGQGTVRIAPDDDTATLAAKVLKVEHALYPAVLRRFAAGDTTPVILPAAT